MNFYDLFVKLCVYKNTTPSVAAREIGISKSNVSNWKRRGTFPTDTNLQKISDYFNVSVEYLKGQEPQQDEHSATDSDENLKFALYGADNKDITPAMLDDVRRFAQFVREHKKDDSNDSNKPV